MKPQALTLEEAEESYYQFCRRYGRFPYSVRLYKGMENLEALKNFYASKNVKINCEE